MPSRWSPVTLASAAALLFAPGRSATQEPAATAFVHVAVIPMDREQVLPDQTVLVRGGHIVALGGAGKVSLPAGTVLVDGRGKFLIPGLADMHVHLDDMDDEIALSLFPANGVTLVRNMRGDPTILDLRKRTAAGTLLGPRIYTAGPIVYHFADIATPEAAKELVAEHKSAGYDFIKVYDMNDLDNPEAFDTFAAVAHQAGISFGGHTPYRIGIERWLRARPVSSEHMSRYFLYLIGQDTAAKNWGSDLDSALKLPVDETKIPRLAHLLKEAGTWVCPTELIRVAMQETSDTTNFQAMLDNYRITDGPAGKVAVLRRKMIKTFADSGVGLLAGSDEGPPGGGMYSGIHQIAPGGEVHTELALLVKAGLTPYQALETATRNPAAFIGALDSTGTIAVGKRADLVLLNANPLEDITHTQALVGTMLGGRWFPRDTLNARFAAAHAPEWWYRR